jgi:hypothetical protein
MRRVRFDLITRINDVVADARDTAERVRRFLERPLPGEGPPPDAPPAGERAADQNGSAVAIAPVPPPQKTPSAFQ